MIILVSPKVGMVNNCLMLSVHDVVPRVRRTNKSKVTKSFQIQQRGDDENWLNMDTVANLQLKDRVVAFTTSELEK